jgi:hypothetical protein
MTLDPDHHDPPDGERPAEDTATGGQVPGRPTGPGSGAPVRPGPSLISRPGFLLPAIFLPLAAFVIIQMRLGARDSGTTTWALTLLFGVLAAGAIGTILGLIAGVTTGRRDALALGAGFGCGTILGVVISVCFAVLLAAMV